MPLIGHNTPAESYLVAYKEVKSLCYFVPTMRVIISLAFLVAASWAKPFHQTQFLDFMLEDEGSGFLPESEGPICPFGCQCHRRVVQCSDLGLTTVPENIPKDTTLLDLQNNKITEIKENDFKNLKNLHALILVNNKIGTVHPKAFVPLVRLQKLYMSKNLLKEIPANMPPSLHELRIHENEITKVKKNVFDNLSQVYALEMGGNPLKNSGIESGAFNGLKKLSFIRLSDADLTTVPKGLPSTMSEIHLDGNKISHMKADSLKGLNNLVRIGLSFNKIIAVDNGTLDRVPYLRELHIDNNALRKVPAGLGDHRYIQVVYLHNNLITAVGVNDFCGLDYYAKKNLYSGISLFNNPVPYWEIQPSTFRCAMNRAVIQLGNFK
ncbi:decorin isoform X1 [Scyliorhinus canicula]|uniref:decorin isoform X1 n=2 Tax=Scyliorhinus canicula TaxID=7830 RepID=UPI0018F3DFB7|nr:decorin isoform X1 [Scyliorhinus canicula]